jgi:hypothetical protein
MPPASYDLYAYSYLRYGVDQARLWVIENLVNGAANGSDVSFPCSQTGYNETFTSSISGNVYTMYDCCSLYSFFSSDTSPLLVWDRAISLLVWH